MSYQMIILISISVLMILLSIFASWIIEKITKKNIGKLTSVTIKFKKQDYKDQNFGELMTIIYPYSYNMIAGIVGICFVLFTTLLNYYNNKDFITNILVFPIFLIAIFAQLLCLWLYSNRLYIYQNAIIIKRLFMKKVFYYNQIDSIAPLHREKTSKSGYETIGYVLTRDKKPLFKFRVNYFKNLEKIRTAFKQDNPNVLSIN